MSGNGNHINFFLICRGLKPSLVRIQAGGPTANDTGRRTKCMNTEEALWTESGSICWGTVADRLKDQEGHTMESAGYYLAVNSLPKYLEAWLLSVYQKVKN